MSRRSVLKEKKIRQFQKPIVVNDSTKTGNKIVFSRPGREAAIAATQRPGKFPK